MTKQEFAALIRQEIVVMDGATGSNLQQRGMPAGVCPEKWMTEHPDIIMNLQREFVAAGSKIVYAPTFTCNRIKLAEYGLAAEIGELNRKLTEMTREAVGDQAYVAGDLTMTGEQLSPVGTMQFEELVDIYKEQVRYLLEAGVDLIGVETMMSLQETRAAVLAVRELCDLPVMATLTFREDGRTFYGSGPANAVVVLQSLGVDAIGLNCSTGPDQMIDLVKEMKAYAEVPIIAKPNAGLPALDEAGNSVYDMGADTFTAYMKELVAAGASIVGGCCGTTPEYIQKLAEAVRQLPIPEVTEKHKRVLASERQVLELDLEDGFKVVGERINPTGKKALQAELKDGVYDRVKNFAQEQEACGASILDINVGMNGIDEKETMLNVISEVTTVSQLPLCIDSSHVEVIEAALRVYPGRALINSISLEKVKFEQLIPIAAKYGAMFILLPLSDAGLPESLEEKKAIIRKVMNGALAAGMRKEDIVVDGLVATVGANQRAALETLETIRYCRHELGLATIIGLSNISFGLPGRPYVNSAFLTMAIREGLTMAIANPSQDLLMLSAFASDLLLNRPGADLTYINKVTSADEKKQQQSSAPAEKVEITPTDRLQQDVMKGNKKGITDSVKQCLEAGAAPGALLDDVLIPAINKVGELFDQQIYFLPQLISSAEAMKTAIGYLEPLLEEKEAGTEKPLIVIATVAGDIHDIGKNLVALMLKNYGYRVIDLGKDVPKEEIVRTAIENQASVIALSALMTTTMQEMKHVITYAKEQGAKAKIIIGGAVITQSYADEIGADGFSRDAAEAVKLVQRLLGE